MAKKNPITNLVGHKFTRWTVLRFSHIKNYRHHWVCKCNCGKIGVVREDGLLNKMTRSCGCLKNETARALKLTHGQSYSRTYSIWQNMIARCTNPKSPKYSYYGGRGITICNQWKSFENFFNDMGECPSIKYTLERVNNELGYSAENCVWATRFDQMNNTRKNRFVTYAGQTKSIAQWAKEFGFIHETLRGRLKRWSVERALTTPIHKRSKVLHSTES